MLEILKRPEIRYAGRAVTALSLVGAVLCAYLYGFKNGQDRGQRDERQNQALQVAKSCLNLPPVTVLLVDSGGYVSLFKNNQRIATTDSITLQNQINPLEITCGINKP